jgi:hypothetical protein
MPEDNVVTVMDLVVKLLEAASVGYFDAPVFMDEIEPTTKAKDLRFLGGYCPLHGRELHVYNMTKPANVGLVEGGTVADHPLQGKLGQDPADFWKM